MSTAMNLGTGTTATRRGSRWIAAAAALALTLSSLAVLSPPARAAGLSPASVEKTALINADSVTLDDGITDAAGNPESLEQFAAEQLGYTVTVVDGTTWDSMTTDEFADYQLLIVGEPDCNETPSSVTINGPTWAAAVMGSDGGQAGNRTIVGTDPEYHYLNGEGQARPTDPSDPTTSGAEHLVQDGMAYAGQVPGATGVYFDTSCGDNGSDIGQVLDNLTTTGPGGWGENQSPPCGGNVSLIASNPAFDAGPTVLTDDDIEGWECSDHVAFPKFPADFDALAVATDTPTTPTCGSDPDSGATVCGQAYVLLAGEDIVATAPNLAVSPTSSSDPMGGSHTVTASVTQGMPAVPLAGKPVTFVVTGVNTGVDGTCTTSSGAADPGCKTDKKGLVQFTYPDANGAGDDTIGASATVSSSVQHATAAETWTGPAATAIATTLSGGGQTGADIQVPPSTAVTDAAGLTGANAGSATGTVRYDVFADSSCTKSVSTGAPQSIVNPGMLPASAPVTESGTGQYYWQASYSGDAMNMPATSTCGSETETVVAASQPATCHLDAVNTSVPTAIRLTVQDPSDGLAGLQVAHTNTKAAVVGFVQGTTKPITGTFTKVNAQLGGVGALQATTGAGAQVPCGAAFKTVGVGTPLSQGFIFNNKKDEVTIQNGATGLTSAELSVNGHATRITLAPGQRYDISLTPLLNANGKNNAVAVHGYGPKGSSAVAVVWGLGVTPF